MFPFVVIAPVFAAEPAPSVEALVALPDHAARIALLAQYLASGPADADAIAAASVAQATVTQLERHGRTDPSVVRLFLVAASSPDPAVRTAALTAASANGDPPLPMAKPASPAPASPPALDPDRIRTYRTRYLHDEPFTLVTFGAYAVGGVAVPYATATTGWAVYQGGGPLRVPALAKVLADEEMLDLLKRRNSTNLALGIVGWTMFGGGLGMSLADVDGNNSGLLYGGLGLALAGMVPAFVPLYAAKKRIWAGKFYEKEVLDAKVSTFNQELQRELSLSSAEVVEAESGD